MGLKIAAILCAVAYMYYTTNALFAAQAMNENLHATIGDIRLQVETSNAALQELDGNVSKIRKETSRLDKTLSRLDLSAEARDNPDDLERRINAATARLLSELESL